MKSSTSSKKVIVNSTIYTVSGLLIKCFSFFLIPLYTRFMTPSDYGVTNLASSFITTMSFIVAFSLFSAVLRFYVDLKEDEARLKKFYGTVVLFSLISGIAWLLILCLCNNLISTYVFSGVEFYPIIFLCVVRLIFFVQHNIYMNVLKSQQRALKASIMSLIYFFSALIMNIVLVVGFKWGALGSITATLVADVIFFIIFLVDMIRNKAISFCIDFSLLKEALAYSIPIMPHNLSTQISILVSSVLIGNKTSLSALGVYSVSAQFGNIADMIQVYVGQAYGPWLYEKLKNKENAYKKNIGSVVKALVALIGLAFLGIALFSQDYVLLFVDKQYFSAWKYTPLLVLVFAIKTSYYFFVEVLFYYKKASKKLFIATLTGSLTNVLISALFIPRYGIMGSIIADAIAMIIRVSIIIIISKKYDDVGIKLNTFVGNFITIVIFTVVGLAPSYLSDMMSFSWLNFGYKVIVIIVYVAYIIISNKEQVNAFMKQVKNRLLKGKVKQEV